jgi:pantothenate kinase
MDVGGTLTKIVYFESKRAGKDYVDPFATATSPAQPSIAQRHSSDNLAHLDCPDHQAALETFYAFMDSNRGMAPPGTVVRDEGLSMYSKFLDGKLHFLHFETRNMVDAIKYVSAAAPIENIRSIGCTGGGAHKFAGEFEEQLEITFIKFDELECLVRGMHFALNNFQDECFTYRPEDSPEMAQTGADSRHSSRPASTNFSASRTSGSGSSTGMSTSTGADSTRTGRSNSFSRATPGTQSIEQDTTVVAPSPYPARPERVSLSRAQSQAQTPGPPRSPSRRDGKEFTRKVLLPVSNGHNGPAFPYLVVNIGSGVSILKVTGPGKAERISGTSIGGGKAHSLLRMPGDCCEDFVYRLSCCCTDVLRGY